MCIIIDRQPDVKIPHHQIERACDINRHGWGIAWVEKNSIKVHRSTDTPSDPKEVIDQLNALKKKRVFLHIRHATIGNVSKANSHPFFILRKDKDGRDLCFMHNGTLWEFDPKDFDKTKSDSLYFAETIVKPLAKRMQAFLPNKTFVTDELFVKLMCKYGTGENKMLFFDNLGGVFCVNKTKGKDFDGYWASNEYSFDINHYRSSEKSYVPYQGNYGGNYSHYGSPLDRHGPHTADQKITASNSAFNQQMRKAHAGDKPTLLLPWQAEPNEPVTQREWAIAEWKKGQQPKQDNILQFPKSSYTRIRYEIQCVSANVKTAKFTGASIMDANGAVKALIEVKRVPFVTLAGLEKLTDLGRLSKSDITSMCEQFPLGMTEAIIDLLAAVQKCSCKNGVLPENRLDTTGTEG